MAGPTRLSWICSTLTEFRLRALRLSRLYLFAIRTRYAPSVRKSAELTICVSRHWHSAIKKSRLVRLFLMAGPTRLELATSCVTGRHSNQLSYDPTPYSIFTSNQLSYDPTPYSIFTSDCSSVGS